MCFTPWSLSARMTISAPVSSLVLASTPIFWAIARSLAQVKTGCDSKRKGRFRPLQEPRPRKRRPSAPSASRCAKYQIYTHATANLVGRFGESKQFPSRRAGDRSHKIAQIGVSEPPPVSHIAAEPGQLAFGKAAGRHLGRFDCPFERNFPAQMPNKFRNSQTVRSRK